MIGIETIPQVLDYGIAGVLLAWIVYLVYQVKSLNKKIDSLDEKLDKKNIEHISDIKSHKDEFGALVQTTPEQIQKLFNELEARLKEYFNGKFSNK